MGVALQHDLDVLHRLLANGPGTGHLVRYLFGSFLQLQLKKKKKKYQCEENEITVM